MVRGSITKQQKLFVDNFLKRRKKNATAAAIDAGYSEKTASSQASQLLKNTKVIGYLEEREAQLEQDLRREFFFDAVEAREVMNLIMNDPTAREADRIAAARYFLDTAGYNATNKIEHSGAVDNNLRVFESLDTETLRQLAKLDQ